MSKKLAAAMKAAHKARTIKRVIEFAGKPATRVRWPWKRARQRAGLGADVTPHVLHDTAGELAGHGRHPDRAGIGICSPAIRPRSGASTASSIRMTRPAPSARSKAHHGVYLSAD